MRGAKRGFNHLPAVARALEPAAHRLVEKATVDIAAGAGAAAPVDTGTLAASYTAEVEGLHGTAGTNVEYGPYVEYGTRFAGAQPHLTPAAEKVRRDIQPLARELGDAIEEAARRG